MLKPLIGDRYGKRNEIFILGIIVYLHIMNCNIYNQLEKLLPFVPIVIIIVCIIILVFSGRDNSSSVSDDKNWQEYLEDDCWENQYGR